MSGSRSWSGLRGRESDCRKLTELLATVKAGDSQVLVLRGEAGIGKTALLEYAVERAAGFRVARAAGIESETDLAYASLHQLCRPYIERIDRLPAPQRDALGTAFGLWPGAGPDRLLVGLAALTLFTSLAEEQPVVCVVDDAQWMDQASAQALEFVARRLGTEPVAMLFAVLPTHEQPTLVGLPDIVLDRLGMGDAVDLLQSAVSAPLHPRVRDRILAESHGNPRALLELPRQMMATEFHGALAIDPAHQAWNRAQEATAPDEILAAQLESSADRAVSDGGLPAAAALLGAAAALTPDPARRARRLLSAAETKATVGAVGDALSHLVAAEAGPLDELGQARVDLLRARLYSDSRHHDETVAQLLVAGRRLEALDGTLAREAYLDAMSTAILAGRLESDFGLDVRQVAVVAREAPPPNVPGKADLLLEGMAVLFTDGYADSAPLLHRAVHAYGKESLTAQEASRSAWVAIVAAADLWDDVHWDLLTQRYLDLGRESGAHSLLPLGYASRAVFDIQRGDLVAAASLVAENQRYVESAGGESSLTSVPQAWLAAVRGQEDVAEPLIQGGLDDAAAHRDSVGMTMMLSARAVLYNGLGRYEDAFGAASEAASQPIELGPATWALAELVEAGARSGNTDVGARASEQLSTMAQASGTDLALGVAAGRAAILLEGEAAEGLYRQAIERLGRTRMRFELARVQLMYGEWLRRVGRRVHSRTQLRTALEALSAMGVEGFADRARRELLATGETVRKRTAGANGELTAQEAHIAGLAADGLTNPEIAAQLYLSPRTVEWHLRKVFGKVGVPTRRHLRRALQERRRGDAW